MKTIHIPGSKSITNRVLLLSAIGPTPVVLHNLLESDDTLYMRAVLSSFGVVFESTGEALKVIPPRTLGGDGESHFIGNAGTVARFVSAVSLVINGSYALQGVDRMHERPQADLFEALRRLGVVVDCQQEEGYLPARYLGQAGILANNEVSLSGQVSSQFVSALLLVAPLVKGGLKVEMAALPPSQPYVEMTLEILKAWQVQMTLEEGGRIMQIKEGLRAPAQYTIPADMSGASYPAAWATLCRKELKIADFGQQTLQGDEAFLTICEHFGMEVVREGEDCLLRPHHEVEEGKGPATFDFSAMPDVAMTGMVLATFFEGAYHFTGLESLRVKECDRIAAMVEGFTQLGIQTVVVGDDLTVQGGTYWQAPSALAALREASIETNSYDDHRIAMCFGVLRAALSHRSGVPESSLFTIGEPHCVAKTWPEFWADLATWQNSLQGREISEKSG